MNLGGMCEYGELHVEGICCRGFDCVSTTSMGMITGVSKDLVVDHDMGELPDKSLRFKCLLNQEG